jgi:hypothetical protein
MAHHYEDMKAATARKKNAQREPCVYGFEGASVDALYKSLGQAIGSDRDVRLFVRLGLDVDGNPEAWLHVKAGEKEIGFYNESFTCPPRPPEDCEE